MTSAYAGKKLSLDKDCIFVQLDNPGDQEAGVRSVVVRLKPKDHLPGHYTPQNESARIVLDLLTLNAHKNKGTIYEDIRDQFLMIFSVDKDQAEADLNEFLSYLEQEKLLEIKGNHDSYSPIKDYPVHPGQHNSKGQITAGGTLISTGSIVGYILVPYRP